MKISDTDEPQKRDEKILRRLRTAIEIDFSALEIVAAALALKLTEDELTEIGDRDIAIFTSHREYGLNIADFRNVRQRLLSEGLALE